jgi:hypothetical protein
MIAAILQKKRRIAMQKRAHSKCIPRLANGTIRTRAVEKCGSFIQSEQPCRKNLCFRVPFSEKLAPIIE